MVCTELHHFLSSIIITRRNFLCFRSKKYAMQILITHFFNGKVLCLNMKSFLNGKKFLIKKTKVINVLKHLKISTVYFPLFEIFLKTHHFFEK